MIVHILLTIHRCSLSLEGLQCGQRGGRGGLLREAGLQGFINGLSGFHRGGCQNYGPFLGPYFHMAPII